MENIMKIIEEGHIYELAHIDGDGTQQLTFVNREGNCSHEGTQNQEVLRALINRVQYLENKLHWDGNAGIIHHLRMALVLHEARVLERKAACCKIAPETIRVGSDGHFAIESE